MALRWAGLGHLRVVSHGTSEFLRFPEVLQIEGISPCVLFVYSMVFQNALAPHENNAILYLWYWNVLEANHCRKGSQVIFLSVRDYHAA